MTVYTIGQYDMNGSTLEGICETMDGASKIVNEILRKNKNTIPFYDGIYVEEVQLNTYFTENGIKHIDRAWYYDYYGDLIEKWSYGKCVYKKEEC